MTDNELFPEAAPDFSDPLGLLKACHDRILSHCDILERVTGELEQSGATLQVAEAASQVHRYFSSAGQLHHQDEEEELFPRLARQSLKLADRVHRARKDHEELDELWGKLAPLLARPSTIEDIKAFQALSTEYADAQRKHVQYENEELLAIAVHIFGHDELRQIGNAMAERRGQQARL